MSASHTTDGFIKPGSASRSWLRALELTAPIAGNRERILSSVVEEAARTYGDALALLADGECLSYNELARRANQYARWALAQGLAKGDVVCLMMENRPEYMAIWLGLTSTGITVALLNTNLAGEALAHSIRVVEAKEILVSSAYSDAVAGALGHLETRPAVQVVGEGGPAFARMNADVALNSGDPLDASERRGTTIEDCALCIYTSGTTGLPKAANVSHGRVMQWSHWFAGMMEVTPEDRMYNCLPMYHAVGGVQATGAMLVGGGSAVLREKFSASKFWVDVARWDCSLVQYIGELCRYLLHTPACAEETEHRIRLACGNGLSAEVWEAFKDRFRIPRILEFYAATEGSLSLFNVQGKPGSIGRIPPYLAHRFSPLLVKVDTETAMPIRNEQGLCIRCASNEAGEALSRLHSGTADVADRFEGYTSEHDSARKIMHDVLEPGDAWVRTGDLMRKDEAGYFYFVDRMGDTFRRKGENVATYEVAKAISEFAGVQHAIVYGVTVPGADGRVGMAAVVADGDLDLAGLQEHLANRLPAYARPMFLRVRTKVELTGTFKYSKTEMVRENYRPDATDEAIYFDDPARKAFVRIDHELYQRIERGEFRL